MPRHKDYTGQRFERLRCVRYVGRSRWDCLCDCGNFVTAYIYSLKKGFTKSCGCWRIDYISGPKPERRKELTTEKLLFAQYRCGAKARDLSFDLTFEVAWDLFSGNCFYCGIVPSQLFKGATVDRSTGIFYNGIDRLDSSKGYTLGNVVSCCKQCNFAKRSASLSDFLSWLSRTHSHCLTLGLISSEQK